MHSDLRGSVIDKNRKNLDSSEREILDSIKTKNCTQAFCGVLCVCVRERKGGSNDVFSSDELTLLGLSCDILAFL